MDIVNYMVLKTSFVTGDQMRAYKSLEAHAFFTNGWVHDIFLKVVDYAKVILRGRV